MWRRSWGRIGNKMQRIRLWMGWMPKERVYLCSRGRVYHCSRGKVYRLIKLSYCNMGRRISSLLWKIYTSRLWNLFKLNRSRSKLKIICLWVGLSIIIWSWRGSWISRRNGWDLGLLKAVFKVSRVLILDLALLLNKLQRPKGRPFRLFHISLVKRHRWIKMMS